jgi:ORF6N domain
MSGNPNITVNVSILIIPFFPCNSYLPKILDPADHQLLAAGGCALTSQQSLIHFRVSCFRFCRLLALQILHLLRSIFATAIGPLFNQFLGRDGVKRNRQRFPEDFMFRLSPEEAKALQASRSQFVTLKRGQNVKYLPYAFTENCDIKTRPR